MWQTRLIIACLNMPIHHDDGIGTCHEILAVAAYQKHVKHCSDCDRNIKSMHEGDKEMKDNYKGKSIAQHTFIRRAGGIAFALVLAVITCLLSFTPAGAQIGITVQISITGQMCRMPSQEQYSREMQFSSRSHRINGRLHFLPRYVYRLGATTL